MTRHLFTFLATFVVGALVALAARTAMHSPAAAVAPIPAPASASTAAPSMATPPAAHKTSAPASTAHAPEPKSGAPINTICAICGMAVDPKLPTLEYQGKRIGFGCKMCPSKFKAEPDKYGPYYLRNELFKP